MQLRIRLVALILLSMFMAGCAANPVTGKKQLALLPASLEIQMGAKQYAPTRQMYGGDYVLDPDLTAYVRKVGLRLAAVSDRELPYEFTVVNNSIPNAWALPGGKIAITRGLLEELDNEAELAAVLGHEIVHAAAGHGVRSVERRLILRGAVLAISIATGGNDFSALAVGAAGLGGELINQRYSREDELEADRYGIVYMVRAGYNPEAAVTLQETFVRLAESKRADWLSGLFASHPPSTERVRKNRETVARLGKATGETGRARYRRATALLRKRKPAYKAYEKARKALKRGDTKTARALMNTALGIEPHEARFYCLLGDIQARQGRKLKALTTYNEAMRLNSNYFRHYYQRGRLWMELGDMHRARRDLEQSLALLPTADGHYALGWLSLRQGRRDRAIQHFRKAAESRSPGGRAALHALYLYDLPNHPDRYLKTHLEKRKGCFRVIIRNTTTVTLAGLRVKVQRSRRKYFEFTVKRTLKPGSRLIVQTLLKVTGEKEIYKWRVSVREVMLANPSRIDMLKNPWAF